MLAGDSIMARLDTLRLLFMQPLHALTSFLEASGLLLSKPGTGCVDGLLLTVPLDDS